MHDQVVCLNFF